MTQYLPGKPTTDHPRQLMRWWVVVAYLCTLFAWGWIALVYADEIMSSSFVRMFVVNDSTQPIPELPALTLPVDNPFLAGVVGLLALCFVAFFFYAVWKAPKNIASTSDAVVEQTSDRLSHIIAKRQHLPKKREIVLHRALVLGLRLGTVLLPSVIMLVASQQTSIFPTSFRWSILLFLTAIAAAGFAYDHTAPRP
ncbi:MAG: hypothetical protein ACM3MA_03080 [Acidobacteriota bacterium]